MLGIRLGVEYRTRLELYRLALKERLRCAGISKTQHEDVSAGTRERTLPISDYSLLPPQAGIQIESREEA